jgi:MATE family multidrug resistance protein
VLALGNVWKMSTQLVAMGFVFGMDPFVSQAHGAADQRGAGLALQRGVVLGLCVSVALGGVWLLAEPGLVRFGQDPELAALAGDYLLVQVPSLPFFMVWVALRQYLTGRRIVNPTMWIVLGANALNAALNWVLIFGHLGAPALGAVGAGIATSIVQALFPFALLAWVVKGRLLEGGWVPWSREALDARALLAILRVGTPVALQLAFEVWAFQIMVLWAGRLGEEPLAAHSIAFNLIALAFMVPLGVSLAAGARVGNLIGARRYRDAQHAAWAAFGLAAAWMCLSGLVLLFARTALPRLYGATPAVAALVAGILPIAAAFQLFDGLQVVGGGVLRGMGRTRPAALFHLVGFYALGLPLAHWLTFERGHALRGLWWGLALALFVIALAFLAWIARRGPSRLGRGAGLG